MQSFPPPAFVSPPPDVTGPNATLTVEVTAGEASGISGIDLRATWDEPVVEDFGWDSVLNMTGVLFLGASSLSSTRDVYKV